MLVGGDFNTWSRQRRAVVEAFAERLRLSAVFEGDDAPRLDAVFVRGLELEEARVVKTRHSDHDALVVRLSTAAASARHPKRVAAFRASQQVKARRRSGE